MKISKNKLLKNNITRNIIKFLYDDQRKKYKESIKSIRKFSKIAQWNIQIKKWQEEKRQELIKSLEQKTDRELLLFCAENIIGLDSWK